MEVVSLLKYGGEEVGRKEKLNKTAVGERKMDGGKRITETMTVTK